jgi:hypothetical protein
MAMRFNPPPNWPPAPAGWQPPPGWQPDPSWPAAPPGWQLWVEDTPAQAGYSSAADAPTQVGHQIPTSQPYTNPQQPYTNPQQPYTNPAQGYSSQTPGASGTSTGLSGFSASSLSVATRWALGGGGAVFIGALLPFISGEVTGNGISGGARFTSAFFGLILIGLGVGAQYASAKTGPRAPSLICGIILLSLAALGFLGYLGFTAIGAVGINQSDGFETIHETFSPNIGLIMSLLGCAAAAYAGFLIVRGKSVAQRVSPGR